ncbi:hypothetical protein BpJC7_20850 [Weizmannia acidilactici]|uniref:Uncharacterized protein n=1 Tax=Weizmannia acidilactici TaxID=2607726 RepID=A0A5J4J782_9BACI|nr:hypothetical protein BpJC4_25120 [Weizmannia acidilactici]GER70782.1 hypothetical protein BpJC7_20850 [Weizmannia acidilactici]
MIFNNIIGLDDIFVWLLESKANTVKVPHLFPKHFDLPEIFAWLDSYRISFNEKDEKGFYFFNAASYPDKIVLYKGMPLALAKSGNNKIYFNIDGAPEITEEFTCHAGGINSALGEPRKR